MILDEKIIMYPPPPPYRVLSSRSRSSISSSTSTSTGAHTRGVYNAHANLAALPAHIHLQIIHHCFPQDAGVPVFPPTYLTNTLPSPSTPSGSGASSSQATAAALARQYAAHLRLYQDTQPERQRKTLYWLATSLRLVSRSLYTACMHVLRSTYLPAYLSMIRPPYTSDPFPLSVPLPGPGSGGNPNAGNAGGNAPSSASMISTGPPAYESYPPSLSSLPSTPTTPLSPTAFPSSPSSFSQTRPSHSLSHHHPQNNQTPLLTPHRETPILDLFIALKVRQDVLADESELHLDREDSFRDLFEVAQPRARLEDLVRAVGGREGVVCVPGYAGYGYAGQGQQQQGWGGSVVSLQPQSAGTAKPPAPPSSSSSQAQARAPAPSAVPTPKPRRSLFSLPFSSSSSSSKKPSPSSSPSPAPQTQRQSTLPTPTSRQEITPIPFSALTISFSPRRVGLVYNKTKTIAEVSRMNTSNGWGAGGAAGAGAGGRSRETLESLAERLVGEVKVFLSG